MLRKCQSPRRICGRASVVPLLEAEPEEAPRAEGELIGLRAYQGEARLAEHLDGRAPLELREVELDRLRELREVEDAENRVALVLADEGEYLPVLGLDEAHR